MAANISQFINSFTKDVARQNRFDVLIPVPLPLLQFLGITKQLNLRCESTNLPGRTMATAEQKFGTNPVEKHAYQANYNDLEMTFIVGNDMQEKIFFDSWMEYINPSDTFDFKYSKSYMCEIQVFQFSDVAKAQGDNAPKPVYQWTLLQAWPILVNPQPITWADSTDILKLSVRFSYKNWYRPGKDSTGTVGEITIQQ